MYALLLPPGGCKKSKWVYGFFSQFGMTGNRSRVLQELREGRAGNLRGLRDENDFGLALFQGFDGDGYFIVGF